MQDQLPDHLTTLSTCPHIQGAQRLSQPEASHFSTITTHGINCYWHSGIADQNKSSHITFVLLMNWNHIIMNCRESVKWRNVSRIHVWLLEQFTERSLKTILCFILPLAAVKTLTKITFEVKLRIHEIHNKQLQYAIPEELTMHHSFHTQNMKQVPNPVPYHRQTMKILKCKQSQSKSFKRVLHHTRITSIVKGFLVLCVYFKIGRSCVTEDVLLCN